MAQVATKADSLRIQDQGSGVDEVDLIKVGTLDGVEISAIAGRTFLGVGVLRSYLDGQTLSWKEPLGTTHGPRVDVSAGGAFLLLGGDDQDIFARVNVTVARMAATPYAAKVYLDNLYLNKVASGDVTAAEASAGDTKTYQLDLYNASTFGLSNLRVWMTALTNYISISFDGASWVTPTSETHGDVLIHPDLAPDATKTLHVRRIIPASTPSSDFENTALSFAFNAL